MAKPINIIADQLLQSDPPPHDGFVYVAWEEGTQWDDRAPRKIGYTKVQCSDEVAARIATLNTGNPRTLIYFALPGGKLMEAEVKRRLDPWRVRCEWFKVTVNAAANLV